MSLSQEQRAAVESEESRCVMSCPGSGKTRTIVAKLQRCVESVRDTSRKIGCITYTNAGVNEISARLKGRGSTHDDLYYEVSTIHSFCLNNVLRPYSHFLEELKNGFEVATSEDEFFREVVEELVEKFDIPAWATTRFERVQREPNNGLFVPDPIPEPAAREFVAKMDEASKVTLNDIVYHSSRLVAEHNFVARGLSYRFAWLLIDEFQDTTACQVAILKRLLAFGKTRFFIVGDRNQSILSFAGAHPELMDEFGNLIGGAAACQLSGNYRCSARIVASAERLCSATPPMKAIGESREFPIEPRHVHCATALEGIWDHFIPELDDLSIPLGSAAVLAPQWFALFHLARALRDRDIPVIGPGARPYRRGREFAQFAEATCAYVETPSTAGSIAVQKAMFIMIINLTGSPDWRVFSYEGKITLCNILRELRGLRQSHRAAIAWLTEAASRVGAILLENDFLPPGKPDVLAESAGAMVADIRKHLADDAEHYSTERLGLFARPDACLHLLTMHGAKGREFDAVAVIDAHDDKVPHFGSHDDADAIEEARRLVYVATTRARKLLTFVTDSSRARNKPSRFLGPDSLDLL